MQRLLLSSQEYGACGTISRIVCGICVDYGSLNTVSVQPQSVDEKKKERILSRLVIIERQNKTENNEGSGGVYNIGTV